MAFTFNDVQNLGSVKAEAAKGSSKQALSNVTNTVKEQGAKAYEGVKGVMPVTNNKFGSLVTQVNQNYNELDSRIWDLEFQIQMLAQATGKQLPSEEEMKEIRRQWEEQQAAEAKAKAEAEAKAQEEVTEPETLADALNDPRVLARLKALLFGTEKEVKEEVKKDEPMLKDTEALDEYVMEEAPAPEEETPVAEEKEKAEGEWKQCVVCGTDISVVYKPDTCPYCKRTAEAEEAKKTGVAPRPRIRFDA